MSCAWAFGCGRRVLLRGGETRPFIEGDDSCRGECWDKKCLSSMFFVFFFSSFFLLFFYTTSTRRNWEGSGSSIRLLASVEAAVSARSSQTEFNKEGTKVGKVEQGVESNSRSNRMAWDTRGKWHGKKRVSKTRGGVWK